MKILAVDYGSKRVGLASGDSKNKIAFPKGVIERNDDLQVVSDILAICEDEGYGKVVFGLPLDMNDEKGAQYQVIEQFISVFKEKVIKEGVDLEIGTVDERLSSFEADSYLEDFKDKKMRKNNGDRDIMAAKIILERYFNA
jgi:putative holliday junction resolvase